ncbi:MAG: phosphomethylpyrimidine synthase ThiC [Thermodesulfobacteriota bacterium]
MTIREDALNGKITPVFEACARKERTTPEKIREGVASGVIAIPKNINHNFEHLMAVGKGLTTKVNANIGASSELPGLEQEIEKLCASLKAGADAVMDLSMGKDVDSIRNKILEHCPVPLGTVPIYQTVSEAVEKQGREICEVTVDEMLGTIRQQAEDGVDFMTIHCGLTRDSLARVKNHQRLMGVVSRGGSFTIEWMKANGLENPFYVHFDEILTILREYEVTISLGDGLRPGCLADATDRGQVQELIHLGELTQRAWDAGVQVIVEGPGHIPMDQIRANILLQKRLCYGAPFYVLGPLVTDIAPGYDHITGAIGGAIAAGAGADFLCYVTPAEHLKLPSPEDVREGVIASRIAAHAADISKGVAGAMARDIEMAKRRNRLDWKGQIEMSLDPEKAWQYRQEGGTYKGDACSMCGSYCALKIYRKAGSGGSEE